MFLKKLYNYFKKKDQSGDSNLDFDEFSKLLKGVDAKLTV